MKTEMTREQVMEAKDLIKKYNLKAVEKDGKMMVFTRAKVTAKDVAAIKEHRDEILKKIMEAKEQEKRAHQERQAKIDAIPGLAEIKAALAKAADWNRRFNASFETESGGGWGVGPRPQYDFEAAYKKYPQAHAYLIAEREAYKSNYELAEIGRRALEKVINGQWEEAMDDLKREKDEFVNRHAWD